MLLVANAIPQVFYQQSSSLVKPLLHAMAHQHSKVRLAAVKVNTNIMHINVERFASTSPVFVLLTLSVHAQRGL